MKAPKANGEAFQRSDVVPKETTTIKVYCCIAGQQRTLKNPGNIKPARLIYWQLFQHCPRKLEKLKTLFYFLIILFLFAGKAGYGAGNSEK